MSVKHYVSKLWLATPVVFLFHSCAVLSEPDNVVKGVIDGRIATDDYPVVFFTASMIANEEDVSIADKIIRWGMVTISDGENEVIMTGGPDFNRIPPYRYYTYDMKGEVGKTYTIHAEYNDIDVWASGKMFAPTPIEDIEVTKLSDRDLYSMTVKFCSPSDGPAYYYVSLRNNVRDRSLPGYMSLAKTGDNGGEMISIPVMKPKKKLVGGTFEPYFEKGEEWEVCLNRVDERVFEYWRMYFNALLTNSSPLTGGAVSLEGNISNGYGIWCVCGSSTRIVKIE